MNIEFTKDEQYIRWHLTQPHVWRASIDDQTAGLNPRLFFIPIDHFMWVKAGDCGLLMFERIDDDVCRVHIAFNKSVIGRSSKILHEVIEWFLSVTSYKTIEGLIPCFNHLAIGMARKSGMTFIKTLSRSFMKDRVAHDQDLFRINREDLLCQY